MSIVKLDSPQMIEGGESKGGNTGTILMVLGAAVLAYFGYKYFQKRKAEKELEANQTSQP